MLLIAMIAVVIQIRISPSKSHAPSSSFDKSQGKLTLSSPALRTSEPPHGDGLLVSQNILQESHGALQLPALDGLSSLASVLERNAEVRAPGTGALGVGDRLSCVTDLCF